MQKEVKKNEKRRETRRKDKREKAKTLPEARINRGTVV
jgi:hypothetical protein